VTRVVLLGASNVTLGFGTITRLVRSGFSGPLDVRAALGHGRSYGAWCSFGFRSLPAIARCELWDALDGVPAAATYALLTDVGNDLIYGSPPDRILRWVETCLDRLSAHGARVVVTRLPVARVERLGPARYHSTRLAFFPFRQTVPWREMLSRVRELDTLLAAAAARRGATVVTPPLDWYGFDPIHIRWSKRTAAWSDILSWWPGFETGRGRSPSLPLIGRLPQHCRLFGRERRTEQPVVRRAGVTLSLY